MADITPNELALVAEKLEKLFRNFNIGLQVGLPNIIALTLPEDINCNNEKAMQDFAHQSLNATEIALHARLEMVFVSADRSLTSIILQGKSRGDIN